MFVFLSCLIDYLFPHVTTHNFSLSIYTPLSLLWYLRIRIIPFENPSGAGEKPCFPLESPEKIRYTDINWFHFGYIRPKGE